jgi:hypothetical protein
MMMHPPAPGPMSPQLHASSESSIPLLRVEAPIRTVSINASLREHAIASSRQRHYQKQAMINELVAKGSRSRRELLAALGIEPDGIHLFIHMTRVAQTLLDDDNLAGAFKAPRDGVAQWLGIDDGSPLVRWTRSQERRRMPLTKVFDRRGRAKLVRTMLLRVEFLLPTLATGDNHG